MVRLINKITHTQMWVTDERLNEYLEAGHELASDTSAKAHEVADTEPKPVKKATKKAPTRKKK